MVLKSVWHEIFDYRLFSWISFPQAPEYPFGVIWNFFTKFKEILESKGWITGVNSTSQKWEKFWDRKFFLILLRRCWVAVYTHITICNFMFILRCWQADVFTPFSLFIAGNNDIRDNLLPVSLSWNRCKSSTCLITGVNDNGDNLSPVSTKLAIIFCH